MILIPAGRSARVWLVLRGVGLSLLSIFVVLCVYFWIPIGGNALGGVGKLVGSAVGLGLFFWVFSLQILRIGRAANPVLHALEVLTTLLAFFVSIFALFYYSLSIHDASAFSVPLTRTGSLYFTITVLSTVGFGDITPVTDTARVYVMVQMALDLVFIASVVKVITTTTGRAVHERTVGALSSDGSPRTARQSGDSASGGEDSDR
ncbi:MAG: potassium channel family protein [Dermatophilaceae bacterium]